MVHGRADGIRRVRTGRRRCRFVPTVYSTSIRGWGAAWTLRSSIVAPSGSTASRCRHRSSGIRERASSRIGANRAFASAHHQARPRGRVCPRPRLVGRCLRTRLRWGSLGWNRRSRTRRGRLRALGSTWLPPSREQRCTHSRRLYTSLALAPDVLVQQVAGALQAERGACGTDRRRAGCRRPTGRRAGCAVAAAGWRCWRQEARLGVRQAGEPHYGCTYPRRGF